MRATSFGMAFCESHLRGMELPDPPPGRLLASMALPLPIAASILAHPHTCSLETSTKRKSTFCTVPNASFSFSLLLMLVGHWQLDTAWEKSLALRTWSTKNRDFSVSKKACCTTFFSSLGIESGWDRDRDCGPAPAPLVVAAAWGGGATAWGLLASSAGGGGGGGVKGWPPWPPGEGAAMLGICAGPRAPPWCCICGGRELFGFPGTGGHAFGPPGGPP
mmetsp:Transcript_13946/g.35100  ORF Transcript_13946/g.35100 Transcript_13946/m.35100 type:complete len:219 (+) Transcript_13946:226-882(+)